jgi:hypothetical protein
VEGTTRRGDHDIARFGLLYEDKGLVFKRK